MIMVGSNSEIESIIRYSNSRFVMTDRSQLFDTATILEAELRTILTGITYTRLVLEADHLVIEDDFTKVMG